MNENKQNNNFSALIASLEKTHLNLQQHAARSVDIALVVRNWLFGYYIVEFENGALQRQELYGKQLIDRLSLELGKQGIKGVSTTSLKQYRSFYLAYQKIRQPLVGESMSLISISSDKKTVQYLYENFRLGWTHYIQLLSVNNENERAFYEIEAIENSWSKRELKRQINSCLFERLSLSRDKAEILKLAQQGQIISKPSDIIKDPYILEFLDFQEHASYSEHQLESAIIDKLEHFLLELGKGFLFEARQKIQEAERIWGIENNFIQP